MPHDAVVSAVEAPAAEERQGVHVREIACNEDEERPGKAVFLLRPELGNQVG